MDRHLKKSEGMGIVKWRIEIWSTKNIIILMLYTHFLRLCRSSYCSLIYHSNWPRLCHKTWQEGKAALMKSVSLSELDLLPQPFTQVRIPNIWHTWGVTMTFNVHKPVIILIIILISNNFNLTIPCLKSA